MTAERLTGTEPRGVVARHHDRYARAIEVAAYYGGVWWDCACGTGYGTAMLPGVAYGFDRDRTAVRAAKADHPGPRYLVTDFAQGGWSSEAPDPDVVVSIETLEHLGRQHQDSMIAEIAARLDASGVFVLMCPIGDGTHRPANPWHKHEPTRAELGSLLARYFATYTVETTHYESTSGPAVQACAVARSPR